MSAARKGIRRIEGQAAAEEMSAPEAYRPLPDHRAKAADYKVRRIIGKALLLVSASIFALLIPGMGKSMSWLFILPAALLISVFWKGFPASCWCPDCKERMVARRKEGRVTRKGKYFDEIGPVGHYLVCDRCKLYLFLGETQD